MLADLGITVVTSKHIRPDEAFLVGWKVNDDGEREIEAAKITGIATP